MSLTGGAANLFGIWYQSLGATAALVDSDWKFSGESPNVNGESRRMGSGPPLRELLLEYLGEDAAIRDQHGIELIQFKVSSQDRLPSFDQNDVREILRKATLAILQHERKNSELHKTEPIVGFIVVSNRPSGNYFDALKHAVKGRWIEVNDQSCLDDFGKQKAPPDLFPEPENAGLKMMHDLAWSITKGDAKGWGFDLGDCINACLKAMANFAFAFVPPQQFIERVSKWLRKWGIFTDEDEDYITRILGKFTWPSNFGKAWNQESIMREVLGSLKAMPLTPPYIGQAVIDDLCSRNWDLPTQNLIEEYRAADCWLLDRPDLLDDLPYLAPEDARIIAITGLGGTGKSALLAQLFAKIGNNVGDLDTDDIQRKEKFLGYPVIRKIGVSALEGIIDNVVGKWAGRNAPLRSSIRRVAVANSLTEADPVVWLGLDGLDEIPDGHLIQLAGDIANYAEDHLQVRIVLTSRPDQLDFVRDILNAKHLNAKQRLLWEINVDEFDTEQAWTAVWQATNGELPPQAISGKLRLKPQTNDLLSAGQMNDAVHFIENRPSEFERFIQDPLFIGVIRQVYEQGDIALIQAACDENLDAMRSLAEEYVSLFCKRVHTHLKCSSVSPREIFNALKQLAKDVGNEPQEAKQSHWVNVCKSSWLKKIEPEDLHEQCKSSGLIKANEGQWGFEWRNPFVGRNLPDMEWRETKHGNN